MADLVRSGLIYTFNLCAFAALVVYLSIAYLTRKRATPNTPFIEGRPIG